MTYAPLVVHADDAERFPLIEHLLLADTSSTGGALTCHRVRLSRGAAGARPHHHEHGSELFFIVEGTLDVLVDHDVLSARAGDLVVVPPGTPHAFAAHAGDTADALIVLTPGIERREYFRQVEAIRSGSLEPSVLETQQQRFDTFFDQDPTWTAHLEARPG